MHFLITAGPTREPIDAVRFLSNASSGRLGFACAKEARRRKHRVTLVSGPVELADPKGVRTIRVTTAREMHRAVLQAYPKVDAVIMTAAVSDYRPEKPRKTKMKKSGKPVRLKLVRNPDILEELGRKKKGKVLVGFALEVQNPVANALKKLKKKNLDLIVLNSPKALGAARSRATVFRKGKKVRHFAGATKELLARWLVQEIERLHSEA